MECYKRTIECSGKSAEKGGGAGGQVELSLELGHVATRRSTPTKEGYTHDWRVYVKAGNDERLDLVVSRVEFKLHETFAQPKRVLKEAPYEVLESGYGGFTMAIEVFLRTTSKPRKLKFSYELYLDLNSNTSHSRIETLLFTNVHGSFFKRLCLASGVSSSVQEKEKEKVVVAGGGSDSSDTKRIVKSGALEANFESADDHVVRENKDKCVDKEEKRQLSNANEKKLTQCDMISSDKSKATVGQANTQKVNKVPQKLTDLQPQQHLESAKQQSKQQAARHPSFDNLESVSPNKILFNGFLLARPQLLSTPDKSHNRNSDLRISSILDRLSLKSKQPYNATVSTLPPGRLNDLIEEQLNLQRIQLLDFLHERLSCLNDRTIVKRIVKIVKKTGHLKILKNSYDFNLEVLDSCTLERIRDELC